MVFAAKFPLDLLPKRRHDTTVDGESWFFEELLFQGNTPLKQVKDYLVRGIKSLCYRDTATGKRIMNDGLL